MSVLHLELLETERGYFTVIAGGRFADMLCRDEALGVIADALFGAPMTKLKYLKTYEEWLDWQRRYRQEHVQIAGLLEMGSAE